MALAALTDGGAGTHSGVHAAEHGLHLTAHLGSGGIVAATGGARYGACQQTVVMGKLGIKARKTPGRQHDSAVRLDTRRFIPGEKRPDTGKHHAVVVHYQILQVVCDHFLQK